MNDDSKTLKILVILFLVSLVSIGLYFIFGYIGIGNIKLSSIDINGSLLGLSGEKEIDRGYNFVVPNAKGSFDNDEFQISNDNDRDVEFVRDDILTDEQRNFAAKQGVPDGQFGQIIIPQIGIYSNILAGGDGDTLMDQGFWVYPSSNTPETGELILLCHRRYFGQYDQRSCWNVNQLEVGELIQINDKNGNPIRYSVKSVTVKSAEDTNIYETSDSSVLKIVSCSLDNSQPGGSTHRVVVIAEKS